MLKNFNYKNFYLIALLILISFVINFYVGSIGVFPVDTFIHYDNGYRILLGDHPIKDYWIVHGFLIDYLQAFFFKIFGNFWHSYLIHSSLINVFVTSFSYLTFRLLKVSYFLAFTLSISIAILAYPVSGTPFLDLHSSFFSLFAIFFAIFGIIKKKDFYWFWSSISLCIAFFSKQVPAAYIILGISLFNVYVAVEKKRFSIFLFYILGGITFLALIFLFLIFSNISIKDFLLQIFFFPQSIGTDRYSSYNLNIKNVFFDFKFIHIIILSLIVINITQIIKAKKYFKKEKFLIFIILLIYSFSIIFHQIYTKNQVYIFFLIPILTGFLFYFSDTINNKFKKPLIYFFLILCLFTTIKYNERYNIKRKFHELTNTNLNNSIKINFFGDKLKGLKWISPHFEDPKNELRKINELYNLLKKDKKNKMLITEYNFLSSMLGQKLHAPSRTYDDISFPLKNSKYFQEYQIFLIKKIKSNNINSIYIFEPKKISNERLNHLIFNYISKDCFKFNDLDILIKHLEVKSCKELG